MLHLSKSVKIHQPQHTFIIRTCDNVPHLWTWLRIQIYIAPLRTIIILHYTFPTQNTSLQSSSPNTVFSFYLFDTKSMPLQCIALFNTRIHNPIYSKYTWIPLRSRIWKYPRRTHLIPQKAKTEKLQVSQCWVSVVLTASRSLMRYYHHHNITHALLSSSYVYHNEWMRYYHHHNHTHIYRGYEYITIITIKIIHIYTVVSECVTIIIITIIIIMYMYVLSS